MPIQTKKNILSIIRDHQEPLRNFGVKRLGLFGSFVREEQNAKSDVDLLVEFEADKKTFKNFIHLCFYLEELFQREVELVTPESLSPYLGPHILREVEYVPFNY